MSLTRDYENGAFIPDADAYPDAWAEEARDWRGAMAQVGQMRALPLGGGLEAELYLPSGRPRGTVVFVHGGYWRRFSPDFFSWAARGPMARDLAVALPAYPLCPSVRLREITAHVADAVDRIAAAMPGGPICVAGHSAGGHLAARMAVTGVLPEATAGRLARVVPISPVGDLRPLRHTAMNEDLRLGPEEAAAESPTLQRPRPGTACEVWVGAEERPAFLGQARDLAAAWDAPLRIAPGRHHFDVLDGLRDPDDPLTVAVDPE